MKAYIQVILAKIQRAIARVNLLLDRIRARVPGLPSNRMLLSAAGLLLLGGLIFVALQVLLSPDQPVTTYTLPYTQNFDEVNLRRWFTNKGVWTIREGKLLQTVGGDEAGQVHIPLKLPEDQAYHASVYITLKKDSKNVGLSFNAQYPDLIEKQHRIYISRINPDLIELVAGYVDETGSFTTQAQVPLTVNTTEFRVDLYVFSNTYLVQVNGQRLIENRPLYYKNGMVGFYALGPVIFDTYKLTAAENQNPGDMVYTSDFDQDPGGAGWVPISGSWQVVKGQMLQSDPAAVDAAIGYETSTFENYTLRATFNHLSGQGAGVLFNMPSPYQVNGAHIARYSDETDSLIWGYYDAQGAFNRQGFLLIPPADRDVHILQVFSGHNSYDVFLDDVLLARDVPLQSIQGAVGLTTSRCSAGFTLVEVFPLFGATQELTPVAKTSTPTAAPTAAPSPTPSAVVLANATPLAFDSSLIVGGGASPYHGVFSGRLPDAGWKALSGDWVFQDGNFLQRKRDGYDFTAVYTKQPYRSFSIQVGLTHQEGSGAGLVFNLPYTDRLAGGYLVRFSDRRDNALVWGYFDEFGVYKNQGYADVTHAGTDRHTLRVVSGETAYSIYMDDRLVAQSVPLVNGQNFGYVGLLTSQTVAVYDEVSVDGVGAIFQGTYNNFDGFSDQRIVSGKWTLESNRATQTVPEAADYVWNTGVLASQYSISATITLPDGDTAGGGFILHMAERGTKNNSYIVRLRDGGTSAWWGSIDSDGKFKGQGSAPVKGSGRTFLLKVVVDVDSMSLFIDGQQIVADVPLPSQDGWIGLVAYGGPVIFEDVKLEVEQ
ncbi:MAG: hypothetical protein ACOY0R_05320 [Chloroflexota bacterium]